MRLADVARRFEKTNVYDGYTGQLLPFKAQTSSFDDHSSIGATSRRRVVSVSTSTGMPTRNVITLFGDTWIVGDKNIDGYIGTEIRAGYNIRKSTGLYEILTPGQAALATVGISAHAYLNIDKDIQDSLNTADVTTYWRAFFAHTEMLYSGSIFRLGTTYYRVRTSYETPDKFTLAESDNLDNCRVAVNFISTGYDLITDTSSIATIATYGLLFNYVQGYTKNNPGLVKQEAGDKLLIVAKSTVTPELGQKVTAGSTAYTVKGIADELDSWLLHVRPA
jgi:hypothetical protein